MYSRIRIQSEDFDLGAEFTALREGCPEAGAMASFVGLVRGLDERGVIEGLWLEHYPRMTLATLDRITQEATRRWSLEGICILHRVGHLPAGAQIVLVLTASAHRALAFEACEYLIDALKTCAEFWKKEITPSGERWIDARASDQAAFERW